MNAVLNLLGQIEDRVSLDRFGLPHPERSSCVMRTPRFRASRHIIWMIIPENGSEPALVAKIPRLREDRSGVEREAAILRAAHLIPQAAEKSIPQVVALEEMQGHVTLLETAMPGRALSPAAIRRDRDAGIRLVTDWLTAFQLPRQTELSEQPDWQDRLIEQPLERLRTCGLLTDSESRLIDKNRELVRVLSEGGFPLVFEHGDLSHPNLLRLPQGGLAVIDWELAEQHGLPASDLLFFLTYVAFSTSKTDTLRNQVRAFDDAFFGKQPWARPEVLNYANELNLPHSLLLPLFVLCWTRYLVGLIGRLAGEDNPSRPLDDRLIAWLRENRYFALWKHTVENADKLAWN